MLKKLRHSLIALGVLCSGSMLATSCVDWIGGQAMLIIEAAVPAHNFGRDCEVDPDTVLASGVLDTVFTTPYRTGLRMRLNLPTTFNTQSLNEDRTKSPSYPSYGNVDSNTVVVEEVIVSMADGDTGEAIPGLPSEAQPRRNPASGVIFNEQQNLNATKDLFVNAITTEESAIIRDGRIGAEIGPTVAKSIIVTMQLSGYTSGGSRIASSKFTLPVEVCRGCLAPAEFFANNNQCPANTRVTPQVCVPPGQDYPSTCQ